MTSMAGRVGRGVGGGMGLLVGATAATIAFVGMKLMAFGTDRRVDQPATHYPPIMSKSIYDHLAQELDRAGLHVLPSSVEHTVHYPTALPPDPHREPILEMRTNPDGETYQKLIAWASGEMYRGVVGVDIPTLGQSLTTDCDMVRDEEEMKLQAMTKVDIKYLRARCGVRYWEDAEINGERDVDGSRIPCREGTAADNDHLDGGDWCPTIELATGKIEGWPEGTVANLHYKVCDDGEYELLDAERCVVATKRGYVPRIMCPGDEPDGDYVVMSIGPDGVISDWRVDLSAWEKR
jgi:hypothetical protein